MYDIHAESKLGDGSPKYLKRCNVELVDDVRLVNDVKIIHKNKFVDVNNLPSPFKKH